MAFPGCGCFKVSVLNEDDLVAALRRFKFRCVSCGSADRIGIHSLIPSTEIEQDLVVAVCASCHFKIVNKTLDIRNNRKAQLLLSEWEQRFPNAREAHSQCFPENYWILDDY